MITLTEELLFVIHWMYCYILAHWRCRVDTVLPATDISIAGYTHCSHYCCQCHLGWLLPIHDVKCLILNWILHYYYICHIISYIELDFILLKFFLIKIVACMLVVKC